MRKFTVSAIITFSVIFSYAIKPVDSNIQDVIHLLNAHGYMLKSFDISELADTTHQIQIHIKECFGDSCVAFKGNFPIIIPSRRMISDFAEENRTPNLYERAENIENGIYTSTKKLNLGFYKSPTDSVTTLSIDIPHNIAFSISLPLKRIVWPQYPEGTYKYGYMDYDTDSVKNGKFIPLGLYGSFWYDEEYNTIRFCGDTIKNENNTILKLSPHYYIIGIIVD
ncbi:MAG: DUF5041 domain-containing protein [Muribaculum sp.]|nr:DUF5041 domain-containing protein [Muribaculum sp.]